MSDSLNGTTYGSPLDYRLKENIEEITNAIDLMKSVKAITYAMKNDTSGMRAQGWLAHEIQSIVPEAASGVKGEVDSQGNPRYQALDYGRITPILYAAIMELNKTMEDLSKRIEQLEMENKH